MPHFISANIPLRWLKPALARLATLLVILSSSVSLAQEDHVGAIAPAELLANYPEFQQEYDAYQPSQLQLNQIQGLAGTEITALFGTWCHDSEREVPRLLKLLEIAEVEVNKLTLYAVDRNKQDPDGYAEKYGLRFTPTIIVSDDKGQELGRIIEKPKTDIASDLAAQLNH
jgi:thiol-disulfide isomerase/thioredoxin